jgi:hypothetical protein
MMSGHRETQLPSLFRAKRRLMRRNKQRFIRVGIATWASLNSEYLFGDGLRV